MITVTPFTHFKCLKRILCHKLSFFSCWLILTAYCLKKGEGIIFSLPIIYKILFFLLLFILFVNYIKKSPAFPKIFSLWKGLLHVPQIIIIIFYGPYYNSKKFQAALLFQCDSRYPTLLKALTGPFTLHQHIDCMVERSGPNQFASIHKEDLIRILDGIQSMRDDYACSRRW